jgi:AraC-like DNA-binding protein
MSDCMEQPHTKTPHQRPQVRLWRAPALGEMELLHASYTAYAFPRHMHEEYVIGVMVGGVEGLRHRGATHTAPSGSLLLVNPGEWHSNYSIHETGFAYRTLYPPVHLVQRVATELAGREQDAPCLRGPVVAEDPTTRRLLLQLHRAIEQNASALEQEARFLAAIAQLITRHSRDPASLPPVRRERSYIRWVRDYLEAHYNENVSLTRLSTLTGVSPFHLLRAFREDVGASPFEYQTQARIAHARRLLRRGCPIAEVALEVGFVDQSHLTRHFKRRVGVTPGQYVIDRKNLQDVKPRT